MHGLAPNNTWKEVSVDELGRLKISTAGESTATEYQADTTAPANPYGILSLGVRHDDESSYASNDGDFSPLMVNSQGRLKVSTMPGIYDVITGELTDVAQTVPIDVSRASNIVMHVKNLGTANMTAGQFLFEGSLDSTDGTDGTWFAIQAVRSSVNTVEVGTGTLSMVIGAGTLYSWEASVNAYNWARVRCSLKPTVNAKPTWRIQRGSYATEPIPAIQTHAITGSVTANIGASGVLTYMDSAANLGASATFTGIARDAGSTPGYTRFVAAAYSDKAGTLKIQNSTDNITWRDSATQTVAADVPAEIRSATTTRYARVVFINGAGVQTAFLLTSAYQRI